VEKIRAVIVDDEPLARETLRLLLRKDPEVEIVGEFGNGAATLRFFRKHEADLLFLDIQMPGMSGFDVLENIAPARMPIVIFVTAFDKHAIHAFEVNALDYLLKPFDDARFEKALERGKAQFHQQVIGNLGQRMMSLIETVREPALISSLDSQSERMLTRFMIKESGRIFFLRAEEVDWIEAADYYIKLHVGRKTHFLRETMNDIHARLDPTQFARVHRSAIVNLDRVKELQEHFNGDYVVILNDGTELKLSRSRRAQIERVLSGLKS
jgi:two-component system LytT family response regulator